VTDPLQGTTQPTEAAQPLEQLYEEEKDDSPPEAAVARRAKSYSDFYDIVRAHIQKDSGKKRRRRKKDASLGALDIEGSDAVSEHQHEPILDVFKDELVEASQQNYL